MAALGRAALYFVGEVEIWQLIYADDFSWTASGPHFFVHLISLLLFYTILGIPFAWGKAGGGLTYEWIGFRMDLTLFEVGLAESRRKWLTEWRQETLDKKAILVQHMADVLGRLQYIALVLDQLRPFLGPLYAWVAATPGGACLRLPPFLRLIFSLLLKTLEKGPAMVSARRSENKALHEFRADAKAEGETIAVGGWLCHPDGPAFSSHFPATAAPRPRQPIERE